MSFDAAPVAYPIPLYLRFSLSARSLLGLNQDFVHTKCAFRRHLDARLVENSSIPCAANEPRIILKVYVRKEVATRQRSMLSTIMRGSSFVLTVIIGFTFALPLACGRDE